MSPELAQNLKSAKIRAEALAVKQNPLEAELEIAELEAMMPRGSAIVAQVNRVVLVPWRFSHVPS